MKSRLFHALVICTFLTSQALADGYSPPSTLPAGAAQDGTDATGVSQVTGGVGIRGWLSSIYSKLTGTLNVALPDEVSGCTGSNTCSVTSAATLASIDMTGYASLTLVVTANASANTISFTQSDDNVNFVAAYAVAVNTGVSGATASNTAVTAVTGYQFTKKMRYLKFAVTTFVSGTTTVTTQLHQNTGRDATFGNVLQSGTAGIGKTGPGFTTAQVPISASATGTTAATTATLAAASGKTTYLCGFSIRANATAAATVTSTVTGVITGTMSFLEWVAPLASGIGLTEPPIGHICIPGSATNTAINVVSGAAGSGGSTTVSAWGYQE